MNPIDKTLERVTAFIRENRISLDGRILVGLSGGADSVSLLRILLMLGSDTVCVHVNHMIRGADADRDEEFCRALCQRLKVPFRSVRVDVPALSRKNRKGLEETARDERRRVFSELYQKLGCSAVALAHNADDRAETLLFNLARGTGVKGLGSIRPVRNDGGVTVIRPLLCLSKKEIISFLSELSEEHVTDATNSDTDYTRNYIRHELLPMFGRINPSYLSNINRAADSAAETDDLISELADAFIGERDRADTDKLCSLHPAVRKRAVIRLYERCSGETLSEVHLRLIDSFICGGENGKRLCLPSGVDAVIDCGTLRFIKRGRTDDYDLRIILGINAIPGRNCAVFLEHSGDLHLSDAHINIYNLVKRVKISSDIIENGIYARNRAEKDSIVYGGMTHEVKKILSEKKIPSSERAGWPVFYDKDGLLFVPPASVRDGIRGDGAYCLSYFEY